MISLCFLVYLGFVYDHHTSFTNFSKFIILLKVATTAFLKLTAFIKSFNHGFYQNENNLICICFINTFVRIKLIVNFCLNSSTIIVVLTSAKLLH